jgi:hypothetical protein
MNARVQRELLIHSIPQCVFSCGTNGFDSGDYPHLWIVSQKSGRKFLRPILHLQS